MVHGIDMLMRMYAAGLRETNLPERLYVFLRPGALPHAAKPLAAGLIPSGILSE